LKFNEVIKQRYQKLGLQIINGLAHGAQYRVARRNYGDNIRHQYDCYLHNDNDDSRPQVIFLYGGNWQSGARSDYRFVADTLCSLGFDVYVPDYRLYPEARFEQIIEDTSRAVDAIMADIANGPVFMMGHSAGAQLGALLTLNKRLLKSPEKIRGFIGLAGPYDFYPFTEDSHWDLFAPEEKYPESQPVNFVTQDAPPLYLLHGELDNRVRRGHSKSLMEKQREAGGQARREVYENMGHVDIILSFSRIHRQKSQVVKDINDFILEIVDEASAEVAR
jgi:acetyl esterase/lipase